MAAATEIDEIGSNRRHTVRPLIPFNQRMTCTIEEACEVSGLGRSRIYELLADARLQAVKIDKRRLIKIQSLKRLLGAGG